MRLTTSLLAAFLIAGPAFAQSAQDGLLGKTTIIPAQRPEIEPDRIFVGNDTNVLETLRALHARGPEEDLAVMAELKAIGLDKIAPPTLMEYSRRQWSQGIAEWDITFGIARTRMMYDRMSCVDRSSHQFQTVAELEFSGYQDFANAYAERSKERKKETLASGLQSGAFFNSKASAWWICSHGISNMSAALAGEALSLEDWWIGETARAEIKAQGEAALGAETGR